MKVLKNYWQTIALIVFMIVGACIGIASPDFALKLKPFGDLFINLIFMFIVPLIFFSISSSIANVGTLKRLGKIMSTTLIVFLVTTVISVGLGIVMFTIFPPLTAEDITAINSSMEITESVANTENLNGFSQFVSSVTTNDFSDLLSRKNILQLIVFSIIVGISTTLVKEKGEAFAKFLKSGNDVIIKAIQIIMYYAPIGLGCYFAALIGELGESLVTGYIRSFIGYCLLSLLFYFVIYTLYAFISGGKKSVIAYWKNITPPSLTALATCSSGVAIPSNIEACKKIGVPDDIAETVIPLGTNIHKEGSLFGSVLKIVFLCLLFGVQIGSGVSILQIFGVSILAGLLISAVPTGGGVISEALILTMFGFPSSALGILSTIAVVIDAPATVINVVGNTVNTMLIAKFVEKKK